MWSHKHGDGHTRYIPLFPCGRKACERAHAIFLGCSCVRNPATSRYFHVVAKHVNGENVVAKHVNGHMPSFWGVAVSEIPLHPVISMWSQSMGTGAMAKPISLQGKIKPSCQLGQRGFLSGLLCHLQKMLLQVVFLLKLPQKAQGGKTALVLYATHCHATMAGLNAYGHTQSLHLLLQA